MSDDLFYLGLGAASQMTNRPKLEHLHYEDGNIYLTMADYNKARQVELEKMYNEKPDDFRRLLGHERTPSPDRNNPNCFCVDGELYPSGQAKDISEILAREGYKYLKNINYPSISDAARDPNYRSAMGMLPNTCDQPDRYLTSPEQEREWKYAHKRVKRELHPPLPGSDAQERKKQKLY